MDFGFAIYADKNVEWEKTTIIIALDQKIKSFFEHREYGSGIQIYTVGIICMSPEFDSDRWNDEQKKYSKSKKLLEYNLKLDYAQIENASEKDIQENVAYRMLGSLGVIDELKIKNFNTEKFKEDLILFFEENEITWDKEPAPVSLSSSGSDTKKTGPKANNNLDGLFNISLMINGVKPLEKAPIAELFQIIQEANPSYLPDRIGAKTPIKTPFSMEGVQKIWSESVNSAGSNNIMFEGPNCRGSLIYNRSEWNSIELRIPWELVFKDSGIERYINLSQRLFLWLNGVYGFSCFVIDYLTNLLVLDFRVCLGGISWLTLFGPPYVDMFGEEVLETVPCLVKEFAEKHYMLLTSEVPMPIKPELVKMQTKVKKHLGTDAFCGRTPPRTMEALEKAKGKFRSPNFANYMESLK